MALCYPKALICLIDKKTNEKSKTRPRFVKQDQIAIVRLEVLGGIICVEPFKDFPQMGRFTLRDEGLCAVLLVLNVDARDLAAVLTCFAIILFL